VLKEPADIAVSTISWAGGAAKAAVAKNRDATPAPILNKLVIVILL